MYASYKGMKRNSKDFERINCFTFQISLYQFILCTRQNYNYSIRTELTVRELTLGVQEHVVSVLSEYSKLRQNH